MFLLKKSSCISQIIMFPKTILEGFMVLLQEEGLTRASCPSVFVGGKSAPEIVFFDKPPENQGEKKI